MKNDLLRFLLVLGLWPAVLLGAEANLTLQVISRPEQSVLPGKIVTVTMLVRNSAAEATNVLEVIEFPKAWKLIGVPVGQLALAAHGEELRIITLAIPPQSVPGAGNVKYGLRSDFTGASTIITTSFAINVSVTNKLEMQIEEQPELVVAGMDYRIGLRVVNQGNTPQRLRLSVVCEPFQKIIFSPSVLEIPAGGVAQATLQVPTSAGVNQKTDQVLTIKATTVESESGLETPALQRTLVVPITPRVSGSIDPFVRIPTQMRFIGIADSLDGSGAMVEYSGGGALDEKGDRTVDFLFRGPGIKDSSEILGRDEYALAYHQTDLDLALGDQIFSLSPLTERFRYGRGAEIKYRGHDFSAKTFYFQNHPDDLETREAGINLHYKFAPTLLVGGNFLQKDGATDFVSGESSGRVYSMETQWHPSKAFQLDLEYARSGNNRLGEFHDTAYRAEVQGRLFDRLEYEARHTHTDPKFLGVYADFDYSHLALRYTITDTLSAHAYYRAYENDLHPDPVKTTISNREQGLVGGLTYKPFSQTEFTLDYNQLRREDVLLPADYDFEERFISLRVRQGFSKFDVQAEVGHGELRNYLRGSGAETLERYGFYLYWRPALSQSYGIFARCGDSSYTDTPQRTVNFGANAAWQFNQKFGLSVQYERNYYDPIIRQQQDHLAANLHYTFRNKHAVELRGDVRWDSSSRRTESLVMVSYSIPLGLPVGKKRSSGTLSGVIQRDLGSTWQPQDNVVLRIGDVAAVSDSAGRFLFPELKPGAYPLQIEQNSIGLNKTTAEKIPETLVVQPGKTTQIKIAVVEVAKLAGTVVLINGKETPASNVRVEIKNADEKLVQYTDHQGRVSFEQLRPGKWIVEIDDSSLPSHHFIEKPRLEYDLKPGETISFQSRALPKNRPINLIDHGQLR